MEGIGEFKSYRARELFELMQQADRDGQLERLFDRYALVDVRGLADYAEMVAEQITVKPGSVVQIAPSQGGHWFDGCFLLVTEVRPWGVLGFVSYPTERDKRPAEAHYRVKNGDFAFIGQCAFAPEHVVRDEEASASGEVKP